MQLSISNLAPRHRTNLNDDSGMGRWSSQRFQGKHNHSVQIFTAYRVSQSSPKGLGLRTAYMQQQRAMNNAGIRGISPRTKILQDLAETINQTLSGSTDVILLMDSNAETSETHLSNFLATTGLQDVFHEDIFQIPTRWPDSRRIDHIFVSHRLSNAIKAIGILPWDTPIISDHLGIFIDLDETRIFGTNHLDPAKHGQRRLRSTAPRRAEAYLSQLKTYVTKSKLQQRLSSLCDKCSNLRYISAADKRRFQSIDNELTEYMLSAERKCFHGKTRHDFSPLLALRGRQLRTIRTTQRRLQRQRKELLKKNASESSVTRITEEINAASTAYRTALKELKETKGNQNRERKTFLTMLERRAEENKQSDVSAILKIINKAEDSTKAYAKIGNTLNPKTISQLDHLLIPSNDGSLQEVHDSSEIFNHLLQRGLHDLSQSEGTPLTKDIFRETLNTHRWTAKWEALAKGEIPNTLPTDIPSSVETVLKSFQPASQSDQKINTIITNTDIERAFNSSNEKTSSSPSGRHYGHYKAISRKENNNEWIINIHRMIISFALEHCCPPTTGAAPFKSGLRRNQDFQKSTGYELSNYLKQT